MGLWSGSVFSYRWKYIIDEVARVVVTHCVCLPDVWCERQKWCAKSVKLLRTRPQPPQLPRDHLLNRTQWPWITQAAQSLHTWCRFHGMLGGAMFTAVCAFACREKVSSELKLGEPHGRDSFDNLSDVWCISDEKWPNNVIPVFRCLSEVAVINNGNH